MHPVNLGGCFGRRARLDFLDLGVRVAQAVDAPDNVIWSRETDMANDIYRPAVLSWKEGA